MERIFQIIKEGDDETQLLFVADVHTLITEKYFNTYWSPESFKQISNQHIIDTVNRHSPKSTLDIGCGLNSFKEKIPNLVGIDPYIDSWGPDQKTTLYEFHRDNSGKQFDAILALESINYGPYPKILQELEMVNNLLADDGHLYMRVNPGVPIRCPGFAMAELIEVFYWTKEFAYKLQTIYGWEIQEFVEDSTEEGRPVYYIHFHKES